MTQIRIKRVYETPETDDGYRILIDRLWPRGMKKENLKYDLWEKDITPSPPLRSWFHKDIPAHWEPFVSMYRKELSESDKVRDFIGRIREFPVITLLYASKEPKYNHAKILQKYLQENI